MWFLLLQLLKLGALENILTDFKRHFFTTLSFVNEEFLIKSPVLLKAFGGHPALAISPMIGFIFIESKTLGNNAILFFTWGIYMITRAGVLRKFPRSYIITGSSIADLIIPTLWPSEILQIDIISLPRTGD